MRWHSAQALAKEDLVNFCTGRMIENILVDQRVPMDDGGYLDFRFAFKFVGVPAFLGFHDDQPYVLKYWIPV